MTLIKVTLFFFTAFVSLTALAGNNDTLKTDSPKRDILESVTARVYDNSVYFNLVITNESKPGFYSLVKVFDDETTESVEIKNIFVNILNQPLLYSFKDKNLSNKPVTYMLIRISFDTEIVQTWKCNDLSGYFCIEKNKIEFAQTNSNKTK